MEDREHRTQNTTEITQLKVGKHIKSKVEGHTRETLGGRMGEGEDESKGRGGGIHGVNRLDTDLSIARKKRK